MSDMAQSPFSQQIADMADAMGLAIYQRFNQAEAALFLRCRIEDLQKLQTQRKIAFIQLTNKETEFFGFQLLEYLCSQIQQSTPAKTTPSNQLERILSTQEVQHLTNLSRTTIWRMERLGKFPARIQLSSTRIGWRNSEIQGWLKNC